MSTAELPTTTMMPITTQELAPRLRTALQATMFNSRRLITPRRIHQIAEEAALSFVHFVNGVQDERTIQSFGYRLASDGLGHTAALAVVGALHESIWERYQTAMIDAPISIGYSNALLAGYMEGREATLLEEQERARIGYNRAQAKIHP